MSVDTRASYLTRSNVEGAATPGANATLSVPVEHVGFVRTIRMLIQEAVYTASLETITVPKEKGDTVVINRWVQMDLENHSQKLVEGTTPGDETGPTQISYNLKVDQYGKVARQTDLLGYTTYGDVARELEEQMQYLRIKHKDTLARDFFLRSGKQLTTDGSGDVDNITSAHVLTVEKLLQICVYMRMCRVRPYANGMYRVIGSQISLEDLRLDLKAGNYAIAANDPAVFLSLGAPKFGNFEFLTTDNYALPVQNAQTTPVTIYTVTVIGAEAAKAATMPELDEFYVGRKKSSESDPLAQRDWVGYKFMWGAKSLDGNAIINLKHASKYDALGGLTIDYGTLPDNVTEAV